MKTFPQVWVLADDRTGDVSQAVGVAEALGWPFEQKEIRYTLLSTLPNVIVGASLIGVTSATRESLVPPWPDVVIAAGRRTAAVARWIKRRSGGHSVLVHIMFPGTAGAAEFDLLAVPKHDRIPMLRGPQMVRMVGAPHRVTAARLVAEAERWHQRLAGLPRPRVALLVGGATKNRHFTSSMGRDLAMKTVALAIPAGGSVLVSTSRRTGAEATAALLAVIPEPRHAFSWGDEGENPYFGYLALADAVVVTGDSTSMCTEACATTGPVYIYAPPKMVAPKHARLHAELYEMGLARPLGGSLVTWTHPPLNPASDIAQAVRDRLGVF